MRNTVWALSALMSISMSMVSLAGTWENGDAWKYRQDDGSYAVNTWIEDSGKWYHFNAEGVMETGWILDGSKWYYAEASGQILQDTSRTIDGVSYTFDASGAWAEQPAANQTEASRTSGEIGPGIKMTGSPKPGKWSGTTYINTWSDYQITLPGTFYDIFTSQGLVSGDANEVVDFIVTSPAGDNMIVGYENMQVEGGPSMMIDVLRRDLKDYQDHPNMTYSESAAQLGGYDYLCIDMGYKDTIAVKCYLRQINHSVMMIIIRYDPVYLDQWNQILSTIQPAQ